MIEELFSWAIVAQTIRISIPYTLAAVGGAFSERSGVVNIALEGILLNGAFAATVGTYWTGSPVAGLALACLAGTLTGLLHAFLCVHGKMDQIISGLAINLLAMGLTKFLLQVIYSSSSNSEPISAFPSFAVSSSGQGFGGLLDTVLGMPFVWITVAVVVGAHLILKKTVFGMRLRAVGEHPQAVETQGVRVRPYRYAGVCLSGLLAGLGGAWLAFHATGFTAGMSNGRGYIALAALIFGKWRPLGAAAACLLFGLAEALQIHLQSLDVGISSHLVQALPFLLTIVALAGVVGRSRAPRALGKPF